MTVPAVISASLVDVRNIAAHKCVRLEIHVMQAFGWPTLADPVPVAIARLDLKAAAGQLEAPKHTKRFADLPLPQQIGMRCNEPEFWRFLDPNCASSDTAADIVRAHCGVESRSEIKPGTEAARLWSELDAGFYAHLRDPHR
jgi:hypothetical protein